MNDITKDILLKDTIKHIDITSFDSRPIIDSMKDMSFSARETANAADIFNMMIKDSKCSIILTIAGSTSAAGCMKIYSDMIKYNMVDAIVATGASIVDMDFFEALGFNHYKGSQFINDSLLRDMYIDRIYDTYIDDVELQQCDMKVKQIADILAPRPYSSQEFIYQMGKYLTDNAVKPDSLIELAYTNNVPVFCPAFTDSSAGFGLVMHQHEKIKEQKPYLTIDSVKDFYDLTKVKIEAGDTGLFMIGGGVPKNFAQDTVVCAELLGAEAPMHKFAIQITVADSRDGACSSSTLKEASSWGKVNPQYEQMVFAEATSVLPLIISYAYHKGDWKKRESRQWARLFAPE